MEKNHLKNGTNKPEKVSSVLLAVFYSLDLINIFFLEKTTVLYTLLGAMLLFCSFVLSSYKNTFKLNSFECRIFSLLILSIAVGCIMNKNLEYTEIIWYFKYIFIVYVLLKDRLWKVPFLIAFFMWSLFLVVQMLSGVKATELTHGVSQNAIGLYLLPFIVLFFIATRDKPSTKYNVFLAVTYSFISVWTGSRSAVIVGLLLMMDCILFEKNRVSKKILLRLVAVGILLFAVVGYLQATGKINAYFDLISGREQRPISEEPRFVIIMEYLESCSLSIKNFLFGAKLGTTPLIAMYGGNPHNMLIRLHANMGLVCFLVITWLIAWTIIRLSKNNKTYLFVFIALLFRGITDSIGFTGSYDPLVLYFIFFTYRNYRRYGIGQIKQK